MVAGCLAGAMAGALARRARRGAVGLELVPLGQLVNPGADNGPIVVRVTAPDAVRDQAHGPHGLVCPLLADDARPAQTILVSLDKCLVE